MKDRRAARLNDTAADPSDFVLSPAWFETSTTTSFTDRMGSNSPRVIPQWKPNRLFEVLLQRMKYLSYDREGVARENGEGILTAQQQQRRYNSTLAMLTSF